MRSLTLFASAITISLGLAGCGTVDNALFGSDQPTETAAPTEPQGLPGTLPGSSPSAQAAAPAPAPADMTGSMASGTAASITPVTIEPGSNTGTAVGHTVSDLRGELSAMQGKIVSSANQLADLKNSAAQYAGAYHEDKAKITTRLQIGTTRGNPELISQWNSAQSALDSLTSNINSMNALGTEIADISSRAHYILNTVQATYNVSGAVDEDHRQLSVLEDETNQTLVLIDRLLKEVSDTIQRQTAYVANERASLTTLAAAIKNGELYGGGLGMPSAPAPVAATTAPTGAPLVTIRFNRSNVEYQQILYSALNRALKARPDATFSVVAVSPTRGTAAAVQMAQTEAQRHAQQVLRAMTDMGVPAERLAVSSATDPTISATEVRVYVR